MVYQRPDQSRMPREFARSDHLEAVPDEQYQPVHDIEGELDPPVSGGA
jgi:hypothetical protein